MKRRWQSEQHRSEEIQRLTCAIHKDVLRTDRTFGFYAASSDNNVNLQSLFNILTTYCVSHPKATYCQGDCCSFSLPPRELLPVEKRLGDSCGLRTVSEASTQFYLLLIENRDDAEHQVYDEIQEESVFGSPVEKPGAEEKTFFMTRAWFVGMNEYASTLLYVMREEALAYICFCSIMRRLRANFATDGVAIATKFHHLKVLLRAIDPVFWSFLESYDAGKAMNDLFPRSTKFF